MQNKSSVESLNSEYQCKKTHTEMNRGHASQTGAAHKNICPDCCEASCAAGSMQTQPVLSLHCFKNFNESILSNDKKCEKKIKIVAEEHEEVNRTCYFSVFFCTDVV